MEVSYIGSLDVYKNGILSGWACDSNGKSCLVEVVINGSTIGYFPCNKEREDLKKSGTCVNGGGFRVDVTSFLVAGTNDVQVKFPNGYLVNIKPVAIEYQQARTVFSDFSPYKSSEKQKKIGVLGNYPFGAELSLGSVLSKIISVLNLTPSQGYDGDEDLNIFFNAPETSRRDYPPSSINYNFESNLKSFIDVAHMKVFGRSVCVIPDEIVSGGRYLTKSDENAAHDGKIVSYEEIKTLGDADLSGLVLQRVINNVLDDNSVFDIRVPIVGSEIPFVYLKSRPKNNRFSNINSSSCIVGVPDVFTEAEVEQIMSFCRELNFEYGELDVLVDVTTKEIWIVDVNNTPGGPPNGLSRKEMDVSVGLLAGAFYRNFVDKSFKMLR